MNESQKWYDTAPASDIIQSLCQYTGMNVATLAKALGISPRSGYRLASGKAKIPGDTQKLLWLLCACPEARTLCGLTPKPKPYPAPRPDIV